MKHFYIPLIFLKHIDHVHFLNEFLVHLWLVFVFSLISLANNKAVDNNGEPTKRSPDFKALYAAAADAVKYEDAIKPIFDTISSNYPKLKAVYVSNAEVHQETQLFTLTCDRQTQLLKRLCKCGKFLPLACTLHLFLGIILKKSILPS